MSVLERVERFVDAHTSRAWRGEELALTHDGRANPVSLLLPDVEALIAVVAEVRDIHKAWGETDGEDVDQLALWEDLQLVLAKAVGP